MRATLISRISIMRSRTFVFCLLIGSAFFLCAQGSLRPRGDVNCDWEVNIADVNQLIEEVLKGVSYHSFYTYAHDVNGDHEINIADINAAIDAVLGGDLPPMPSYSGTLPVLYINTDGYQAIVGKENTDYLHADWWLDAMGDEGTASLGSSSSPLGMLIRGRGNYSWQHHNKKPFRIKLDSKQPLMGMKRNRHFCLLPHDLWSTPFGFELSRRMGLAYTPAEKPVEVVLNGQYIGLYLLTEKIRIGKDRVNIVEQENGETDAECITGGWLVEIDDHVDPDQFVFREGNGNWIGVKYHSPDSLSPQQFNYIYQLFRTTDNAIYGAGDTCRTFTDYIDIDTLSCFYIINEIADNIESFTNSLYLHKQRGDSTKLMFGPVWDMGCTYGRPELEEPCFIYEKTEGNFTPHWLRQLATYPEFQEAVRRHWNRFRTSGLETMEEYMNGVVDRMTSASLADHVRWPEEYIWFNDIKIYNDDYYIPQFRNKVKFLNEQWGEELPTEP